MTDPAAARTKRARALSSDSRVANRANQGASKSTQGEPKLRQPWWRSLGPGLITGAADDDPSGIATYSQGGAQFGYDVAWTVLLT